jgi:peroxin-16
MRTLPSAFDPFTKTHGRLGANFRRSTLKGLTGKMKGKPLLDLVGSIIEDYEYLWDNYYFPTATL